MLPGGLGTALIWGIWREGSGRGITVVLSMDSWKLAGFASWWVGSIEIDYPEFQLGGCGIKAWDRGESEGKLGGVGEWNIH